MTRLTIYCGVALLVLGSCPRAVEIIRGDIGKIHWHQNEMKAQLGPRLVHDTRDVLFEWLQNYVLVSLSLSTGNNI